MIPHVLLIDDDLKLGQLLQEFFGQFDIELTSIQNPEQTFSAIESRAFDVIILDVMFPNADGLELCKKIRVRSNIPIIMLSGRGEVTDRISGLDGGADDYISKPFDPRELLSRILSIIRRIKKLEQPEKTLHFGPLSIYVDTSEVLVSGRKVILSNTEFQLLLLLAKRPGEILSRDEIMRALQGVDSSVFSRSIDILVSRLRSKIGDDKKSPRFIKTSWGRGYLFWTSYD